MVYEGHVETRFDRLAFPRCWLQVLSSFMTTIVSSSGSLSRAISGRCAVVMSFVPAWLSAKIGILCNNLVSCRVVEAIVERESFLPMQ